MNVYILVKVDFGHRENMGLFDSRAKALALQTSLELENFDGSGLCGISFEIEEWHVK